MQSGLIFNNFKKPKKLNLEKYITRIWQYTKLEESTLITAFCLVNKICDKSLILTHMNVFSLVLAAITIAIKLQEDDFYSGKFYSKVGGISLEELNALESAFLEYCDFDVHVSLDEFSSCLLKLNESSKDF